MIDEHDVRRVLVAHENAAAWCEGLASLAIRFIEAVRDGGRPSDEEIHGAMMEVAETVKRLGANHEEVRLIRARMGL